VGGRPPDLGPTASATSNSIDVAFNLRTNGSKLSEQDLPLAPGDASPKLAALPGEIGIAVRDPRQVVQFLESAFQAVDPSGFGDYEKGKIALSSRYKIDVDKDVFAQLTGDLSVSIGVDGSFGARAEVKDPTAFKATVAKLAEALPQFGSALGVSGVTQSGDLYTAHLKGGSRFVFGVIDNVLVVGTDAAHARGLAAAQPRAVDGAKGSLVLDADAQQLGAKLLQRLAPKLGLPPSLPAKIFTQPLKDLKGSATSSTDGVRGQVSLTLK
jgi:hypothetical protein